MKHRLFAVAACLLTATVAHAKAATEIPAVPDELLNPAAPDAGAVSDLRTQMLSEAGKTAGFQSGLAQRAALLKEAVEKRAEALDKMFRFSVLIGRDGALPPVVTEARDAAAFSPDQIRTAYRVYDVVREERFVSVPPTWRDYVFVGLPERSGIALPAKAARPEDDKELRIWQDAVAGGWEDGQRQADVIVSANFHRLARDYAGMLRYSLLLRQGMMTRTETAESERPVSVNGTNMKLGDKLKRMTQKARFEADSDKWNVVPRVVLRPQEDRRE
jgi:defect-in-organelle-trafficking protein DotC